MKTLTLQLLFLSLLNLINCNFRRAAFGNIPKSATYPYTSQVLVHIRKQDGSDPPKMKNFTCTGTVVAPHVVLTAGHCLHSRDNYRVQSISIRYGGFIRQEHMIETDASGWVKHPSFSSGVDLGVISTIHQIYIPCDHMVFPEKWDLTTSVLTQHRDTFMCGWGRTELGKGNSLRCIEHKAVHLECHKQGNFTWCLQPTPIRLSNGTIGYQTSCSGDSGAGIFWKVLCQPDSEYQLVMILRGVRYNGTHVGCGNDRDDVGTYLYSNETELHEWITNEINENGGTKCPPDE